MLPLVTSCPLFLLDLVKTSCVICCVDGHSGKGMPDQIPVSSKHPMLGQQISAALEHKRIENYVNSVLGHDLRCTAMLDSGKPGLKR